MRRIGAIVSIIALPLFWSGCPQPDFPGDDLPELELVRVLPVESPWPVEPSGLVINAGILYTVCDKTDDWIFRVEVGEDQAVLIPHLQFAVPGTMAPMDWEGITIDHHGRFYLASEFLNRILRVDPDGTTEWATSSLRSLARPHGMLRRLNAGLEGICILPDGGFLLAAEREDRGFIRIHPEDAGLPHEFYPMPGTRFRGALPFWRMPDWAGLARDGDRIFGLFRNAHLVVRLKVADGEVEESAEAWSYAHIENDPEHAYVEQRFGQAEGIAVAGEMIYLIYDNNQNPRIANIHDRRPQLVIARFPQSGESR